VITKIDWVDNQFSLVCWTLKVANLLELRSTFQRGEGFKLHKISTTIKRKSYDVSLAS